MTLRYSSMVLSCRVMFAIAFGAIACLAPVTAFSEDGPNVVPGTEFADPATAAKMFREICVLTSPDFANGPAALRRLGFNLKTDTGTYYHPKFDLSAHVHATTHPRQCSFVTIGKSDPQETADMFAAVTFVDVPKADRAKTLVKSGRPGFMNVYHPGLGYFDFESKPYKDRTVFHAVLQPDE